MSKKQCTLAKEFRLHGKGLHTGVDVNITFKPAPENHGYKFCRIDLQDKPIINAVADNVSDTSRGTTLEENNIKVSTIEHVLASLKGMGIDNALIEVDAPEMPIMDGSARLFTEALQQAGIVQQQENRIVYNLQEKIHYANAEKGIEITAYPDDHLSIEVLIDYPSNVLRNQYAELNDIADFATEVASCRTFVFFHELEVLLKNNLIKGGDIENAVVIIDKEVKQSELDKMADLFNRPHIQAKPGNILSNPDLYFINEPARHKLLDVLGDIALVGMPFNARIIAKRPGHMANTEFAKIVRKTLRKQDEAPVYDPNEPAMMDVNQVMKFLPHRPPFLFVDKILQMNDTGIVGLKNVTINESYFVGHFPGEPITPGVLLTETMAQVGGIFVLNTVPDPENYLTYFMKIEEAKFREKVVPGDTVLFKLELLSPIRRGICHMHGRAFVGKKIVMEAKLMAQVAKVK